MKTLLAVTAVLLAAAAALHLASGGARQADAGTKIPVVQVTRRTLSAEVKATGVVRPMTGAQVRVGPRVSGIVRRLAVRVGDRVGAGQLLAELDDRELAARCRESAAAVDLARANLAYATADLRRKRALATAHLLAASDLDLAERSAAVAEQEVVRAAAVLDSATTELGYTRVHAPIGGVVASVATQEGETVAASFATPTFVTLLDLDRLEVWAYVDETDIGRVRAGQPATFTVDTYGAEAFAGVVDRIQPQAEIRDNVVDYVAVVRVRAHPDRVLRPEMTTTVHIATASHAGVLAIPPAAVRHDGQGSFAWRRRGALTERAPLSLGLRTDDAWEITAGVTEGDELLLAAPGGADGETP